MKRRTDTQAQQYRIRAEYAARKMEDAVNSRVARTYGTDRLGRFETQTLSAFAREVATREPTARH
jgi:hypothetical protein